MSGEGDSMTEAVKAGDMRRHDSDDVTKDAEADCMARHGGGMLQHAR